MNLYISSYIITTVSIHLYISVPFLVGRELIQLVSKFRSDFLLVDVLIIKTIFYLYLFLSWAIVTICSIYIIRTVVLLIIAALMTFFFRCMLDFLLMITFGISKQTEPII